MAGFGEYLDSWFSNQNLFYICKGLVSKIRHCRKAAKRWQIVLSDTITNLKTKQIMKIFITLLATIISTISFSQEIDFSKNELIVEFKDSNYKNKSKLFKSNKRLNIINDSLKLDSFEIIGNKKSKKTFLLKFKNELDIKSIIEVYSNTNLFNYVEPNYIGKGHGFLQTTPNDPFFLSRQWSHFNNGSFSLSPSTNDADIDTDLAWDITQGDPNLIVAILDSGLKLDHPEFSGRIVSGYDFVNSDADPTDDHGHGTNVAGIALAKGNNSIGYAGVNWNSKIMACKVLDNNNSGYYSWWADAIYFAVDNGAKVINLSAGGNSSSTLLENAINYAYNNNVSVIVSTGNQNSTIQYPAKYTNAIAVGSTNSNDIRSNPFFWSTTSGSNYGPELDFVAPGNYIYGLSHLSNTDYSYYWGGTSQAAPHVAGVISLLLSVNPSLTVNQIRLILQQSSQDLVGDSFDTAGWDQYYGFGRINAFNAISNPLLSNTEYYSESKNLKIFPNPISNESSFSISGLESNINYDIKMVSLDGKIVKEINNIKTDGILKIENKFLQSGIYILNIYNLNSKLIFNKKIIVK
jgi:subtilisin family serine protease